ncbi:MAG: thiosulfate oxidation carrier protein SoxY [Gammaproteobacteria bacterium]|nr:thiosulfate oxidation carrier protein SoxY [Gammaproteobacteria bacterium]MDH5803493.1 thiosulfate oxidation carrier protein SoxY [Gammaproteobacteria bacterium]
MKRRTFLKGTIAGSMVGTAIGAGLLTPRMVLAAWPSASFKAKTVSEALSELHGTSDTKQSGDIKIKAPDIAENGAVVPITISTKMSNVEAITVLVEKNPQPLVCNFNLASNATGFASTRIKMGKTSPITAIVKSGGKLYSNSKTVKVTIGGCGG